jgi:hypothetical protein
MKRGLALPLLFLLILGSACAVPVSESSPAKPSPKVIATLKTALETARKELRENEKELGKAEVEIGFSQGKPASSVSPRLLARREELREKILQSRVNVRELEILLDEE